MREFNELDHFYEKRLNSSFAHANRYVAQFPSMYMSIIAKFAIFVSSSICGVIIILSLLDEAVLLYVKVGDRNLLWYLAICGLVIASARPFVIDSHTNFEPDKAFADLVEHTHYFPSRWRNSVHSPCTFQAFSALFPFKVATFFYEVLSIFVVPLILILHLPKQAGAITKFVQDFTETRPELGDVCSFAVFDFERHGHAKYGSHVPHDKYYRSRQGKMEKSFLTFLENNPNWTPSENGLLLVKKVQDRQQELSASMASLASEKMADDLVSSMHSSMEDLASSFSNFQDPNEV
jgi:autophagy-related protein 9